MTATTTAAPTQGHSPAIDLPGPVEAINWNHIADEKDLEVWHRLTGNFWRPDKVPLAGDTQSWATLTDDEKRMTARVLAGLTLLDTVQSSVGAISLIPDALTQQEEAVYCNSACMAACHAKAYPSSVS